MSGIEYADHRHGRGGSQFPVSWGIAPGDPDSEERARWVRRKVREHMAGAPMPQSRALSILVDRLEEEYRSS